MTKFGCSLFITCLLLIFQPSLFSQDENESPTPIETEQGEAPTIEEHHEEGNGEEKKEEGNGEEKKEEEKPECPTLFVDLGLFNKYVFRGLNIVDGPVFQPYVIVSYHGFSFETWVNYNYTDREPFVEDPFHQVTEIDLILWYTHTFKCWDFDLIIGATDFQFPNTDFHDSLEPYIAIATHYFLHPKVTLYRDVRFINGYTAEFAISESFDDLITANWWCDTKFSLSLAFSASTRYCDWHYVHKLYGIIDAPKKGVWSDADFYLGMPMKIGDHFTLLPSMRLTTLISKTLKDNLPHPRNCVLGIEAIFTW